MNRHWRVGRLVSTRLIARDVRQLVIEVDGESVPFNPGSHVAVRVLIDGQPAIRTYTCIPTQNGHASIAVKLLPHSRGGSRYIWSLAEGDEMALSLPENRFSLSWRAPTYVLIAGGIGITPLYGMARALAEKGAAVHLHYGAQNRAAMPFADELEELLGDRLSLYFSDAGQRVSCAGVIGAMADADELYVCGPNGMLDDVAAAWARFNRAPGQLRVEVFGGSSRAREVMFEVDILNMDKVVQVPPDKSLLDALLGAGVDMVYDCERGECGLCMVDIVSHEGAIDHRDVFLSKAEKASGQKLCACVSRFESGRAVIDVGYRPMEKS